MKHGFCKVTSEKVLLGFTSDAPIFNNAKDLPVRLLIESTGPIDAYSVIEEGKDQGFLYYPHQHAMAVKLAEQLTFNTGKPYVCIQLQVGDNV